MQLLPASPPLVERCLHFSRFLWRKLPCSLLVLPTAGSSLRPEGLQSQLLPALLHSSFRDFVCFSVLHTVMHMFQFYSLNWSQPLLPLLCSQVCSFHNIYCHSALTCLYDSVWECVCWRTGEDTTVSISGAEMSPLRGCTP